MNVRTKPSSDSAGSAFETRLNGARQVPTVLIRSAGPAERNARRHARARRITAIGLGVGVPIAILLLWQIATHQGWVDKRLYPAPSRIWSNIVEMGGDGELVQHVVVTLRRMVFGYSIGAATGFVVGFLMGLSWIVRVALEPLLNGLYTVPKIALLPVFIAVFGIGEAPIVGLVAVTVFFFVWISTMTAVAAVPQGYVDAAKSVDASWWQTVRYVWLPACLVDIFVGLRIAASVAVLVVVAAEFIVAREGLGYLIEQGRQVFLPEQMFAGIILAAVLGVVAVSVVRRVGMVLTPWDRSRRDSTTRF